MARANRHSSTTGPAAGFFGVLLYLLLNWSYTVAVFTPPGSTTNDNGYSTLPTHVHSNATSFTVKSNGEMRFCKKCQARKPDRAHHCSTCRRCVLKMDHHCPWLATCIGLRNHKAFLLFLMYTTVFSAYSFLLSGSWVWVEIMNNTQYVETMMPINYIMLCVIAGIITLVVGAFTGWHIYLASRGQTTIECLEKTRYLSPLRKSMQAFANQHPGVAQQIVGIHQNAIPGVTRPEEGEEMRPLDRLSAVQGDPELAGGSRRLTYDELERYRARKRYEEYLDEEDSSKLPNAFDLGAKGNLLHLFGPSPLLWVLPICNTTGDGWSWEASPRWLAARDATARERQEQRERERAAGWGGDDTPGHTPTFAPGHVESGAGRHYLQSSAPHTQLQAKQGANGRSSPALSPGRRFTSKADRVLGRDPNLYADGLAADPHAVSMTRLNKAGHAVPDVYDEGDDNQDFSESSDDEPTATLLAADQSKSVNVGPRSNGLGWGRGGASGLLRNQSQNAVRSRDYKDEDEID